jgi:hypothetical protein
MICGLNVRVEGVTKEHIDKGRSGWVVRWEMVGSDDHFAELAEGGVVVRPVGRGEIRLDVA